MEIIDSRIANWKIKLADTIADNASSARLVVGVGATATPELLDALPETVLTLERNGEAVASGAGREVLGDPILGALWVVNRLGELGEDIAAGEIILAGAVHASVPLESGVTWSVSAPGFASASITTSH
jgi:2-keto-4-pentenoate hydratase